MPPSSYPQLVGRLRATLRVVRIGSDATMTVVPDAQNPFLYSARGLTPSTSVNRLGQTKRARRPEPPPDDHGHGPRALSGGHGRVELARGGRSRSPVPPMKSVRAAVAARGRARGAGPYRARLPSRWSRRADDRRVPGLPVRRA